LDQKVALSDDSKQGLMEIFEDKGIYVYSDQAHALHLYFLSSLSLLSRPLDHQLFFLTM
jgi:hypothetical protein